jgi:glycosyltransferase involved in cell wall biosynthesis
MNILILSTKMPWPPRDGGAIATLNLATGLARNGADVTLLAMNTGKHYFPPEDIPARIRDILHIRSVDVDTRIRPLALMRNFLFSSYPYIAERFISEPFRQELEKSLIETDFDIFQIEGPYLGHYLPFTGKGPIHSLRAHNLEYRIWELRASEEKNPFKRLYFRSLSRRIRELEKRLLRELDVLVPISETDAEGFQTMRHDLPVLVCPTGMDLENYPAGYSEGEIRLFYIGALDWAPNQEGLDWFFRNAWPAILERWPELVLHIAGRNSSHYFTSSHPPNVYQEGEIDDAISFYRENNVMIVPLLSGSGIRIKILEAMAMGKVVISSTIGASGLGVRDGEHLFIADSAADYIRILASLSKHPRLMRETGHQARQFVIENFDNLVLSKRLISFYKAQLA